MESPRPPEEREDVVPNPKAMRRRPRANAVSTGSAKARTARSRDGTAVRTAVQPIAADTTCRGVRAGNASRSSPATTSSSPSTRAATSQSTTRLELGSAVMMPGMTRTLPTPARLPISVPRDGTLRIRTTGDADVRCRLFDSAGRLVLEGSENGADWNCAIAEPVRRASTCWCSKARRSRAARRTCRSPSPPSRTRRR